MDLRKFWPGVMLEYQYTNTPHMRPVQERRYLDVVENLGELGVMTTPCVMHVLNKACQCLEEGEIYLEIGCYRGSTMIGALLGNDARAIAVDDRSEPIHIDGKNDQLEFERNLRVWGMEERVQFIKARYQDFYPRADIPPAGVLFLDGFSQSAEETYQMITSALPLLADRALIVLDDGNMQKMEHGAYRFVEESEGRAMLFMHMKTPEIRSHPKFPTWWNGLIVIGWER